MNWSGYSFDPQNNLLFVNTNNLPARVRLIPRDKVNSDNEDGNYGAQRGTPYGMLRRFIQSPSDLPCSPPPWGTADRRGLWPTARFGGRFPSAR